MKNCYEKTVQNMASVMVYNIRNTIRQYCAKKRSRKTDELIVVGKCINEHLQQNDVCIVEFINATSQLIPLKEEKNKIPHTCCNYVQSMKCIKEHIRTVPCAAQNETLLMEFLRKIFGPMVDLMCGDYSESNNKCRELGPAPKPNKPNTKRYVSFVILLTDLLKSMKNFGGF